MTSLSMLFLGLVAVGILAPYLLPRTSLSPMTGVLLWLGVLSLRAVLVTFSAFLVVLFLPATEVFEILTHWCFHAVLPFLTTHLGFSGHGVGDAASILPMLLIATSAAWAVFAVIRTAWTMRHWIRRSSLGIGPGKSVIVGGEEVVVAAAGIRSPKVVISTGALAQLDDDELAASLEHERGHIARRHPYLVVAGNLAFAVARLTPGSKAAFKRLRFYLERDADEYAVKRTNDPVALASAICKAAVDSPTPNAALATLSGSGTPTRLKFLLDRSAANPKQWSENVARTLLATMLATVLLSFAAAPAIAKTGVDGLHEAPPAHSCE